MTTIVFATNNAHKLEEMRGILAGAIRVLSLEEVGCRDEIPETAATLEGNALLKVRYVKEHYGCDCFADDTGLEVEALGNAPGVYSARYAGEGHDAAANVRKLLHEMKGEDNRKARFRTVIALTLEGREYTFEGVIQGVILEEGRGGEGFGYDPVFQPEGYSRSFAEMDSDSKNGISHRARAAQKLATFLSNTLQK
jgi:XTP/dITP diphosphohydrolase